MTGTKSARVVTPFQREIYYVLKPAIPLRVRLALRRWLARRNREKFSDIWPIRPGSEGTLNGWPGWPDSRRFAFILTHDVESQKGVDRVKQLAELETSLGFRSSFNFVPEGDYRVSEELRRWLTDRGFEVGVHDLHHDGKLYRSREGFRRRASRINHYLTEWNAVGFRSGFMHHNLAWLPDLNIAYDASTFDTDPFEPQPEGVDTIFPFWVPALEGRGYAELPYTLVQDLNLFVILKENTSSIWKKKLDWIVSHSGMALMNVHPDYMCFGNTRPGRVEYPVVLYQEFLQWIKDGYAGQYWHVLPKDVAAFCRTAACGQRLSRRLE